jgi:predicted Zn-dependent protease
LPKTAAPIRRWLRATSLACAALCSSALATAQTTPCAQDPERHAQLAEQDTLQWFELQARYGGHTPSERALAIFATLVQAQRHAEPETAWIDWRLRGYGATAINAHALHTGTVLMTRGLDDPDMPDEALAASLAHEMGHVLLRHGMEQACFALRSVNPSLSLRQAQSDLAQEGWSSQAELGQRMRALTQLHELQADAKAVQLLSRAGFAADAMSQLMAYLVERQPTAAGFSAGSHPSVWARREQAQRIESAQMRKVSGSTAPGP